MLDTDLITTTAPAPPLERPPGRWRRPEVLLILQSRDDFEVARAAAHLIGLGVRAAASFRFAASGETTRLPILIVYDAELPCHARDERRLLDRLRALEIPLLCISDTPQPLIPDEVLCRPLTPLELLGAASRAQPELYDLGPSETVEPDLEDKLLLLTHDLRRAADERELTLTQAAVALLNVLRLRDVETVMHCYRVRAYAHALAEIVAPEILDDHTTDLGFLLHDIGKLALPDSILQKPGPLTSAERHLMQTHPVIGAEMAHRFLGDSRGLNVIRHHHERWDGAGYPDQLARNAIPIEARIFATADALDALTSDRPYRRAQQWNSALDTLVEEAGTHFDPVAITAVQDGAELLHRLRDEPFAAHLDQQLGV